MQDPQARKLPALRRIAREQRDHARPRWRSSATTCRTSARSAQVGLPVAVGNATDEAWRAARHGVWLSRPGGRGAVREFAELLLKARGEWDEVTERYVAHCSADEEPREALA